MLQLCYTTPNGAGIVRTIPSENAVISKALKRMRCDAILRDVTGKEVGGVYYEDREYHRWVYWFETQPE